MSTVMQHSSNLEINIQLTEVARKHIMDYLAASPQDKGIRFSVKKTGCSGYSYQIETVPEAQVQDFCQPLDAHYFMCIDKMSYPLLQGMTVDYVKQGVNYKFVFINPNQKGQCGCGESFTVE